MLRQSLVPFCAALLIAAAGLTFAQQGIGNTAPEAVPQTPAAADVDVDVDVDVDANADIDATTTPDVPVADAVPTHTPAAENTDLDAPAKDAATDTPAVDTNVNTDTKANTGVNADAKTDTPAVDTNVEADTKANADVDADADVNKTPADENVRSGVEADRNGDLTPPNQPARPGDVQDRRDREPFDGSINARNRQTTDLGLRLQRQNDRFVIREFNRQGLFADSDLRMNDEIVSINGRQFDSNAQLSTYIHEHRGEPLTFVVMRDGQRRTIDVTLHDSDVAQRDVRSNGFNQPGQSPARPVLGVWVLPSEQGLNVVGVVADGPAHLAGLQRGDRILSINDKACDSPRGLIDCLDQVGMQEMATVEFNRMGEVQTAQVQLRDYNDVFAMNNQQFERPFNQNAQRYTSFRMDPTEFRQVRIENMERQIDAMDQQLEQMRRELADLRQQAPRADRGNVTGNLNDDRPEPPLNGGAIRQGEPANEAPRLDAPPAPNGADMNPANGDGTVFDPDGAPTGRLNQDD